MKKKSVLGYWLNGLPVLFWLLQFLLSFLESKYRDQIDLDIAFSLMMWGLVQLPILAGVLNGVFASDAGHFVRMNCAFGASQLAGFLLRSVLYALFIVDDIVGRAVVLLVSGLVILGWGVLTLVLYLIRRYADKKKAMNPQPTDHE